MAEIARDGVVDLASPAPHPNSKHSGIDAGEDIAAGDAVYKKAADGKWWRATGAAATEAARIWGYAFKACFAGQPLTLVKEGKFHYGTGLTIGARLFLSGTVPGGLADAASTGGTHTCGVVDDDTKVWLWPTIDRQ